MEIASQSAGASLPRPHISSDELVFCGVKHLRTTHVPGLIEVYTPADLDHLELLNKYPARQSFTTSVNSKDLLSRTIPLESQIKKNLQNMPVEDKRTFGPLLAELALLFSERVAQERVKIAIFSMYSKKTSESYPGEGLHLDFNALRLYLSLSEGFEWVMPDTIDPNALKVAGKGRDPESMFIGAVPEYGRVKAGDVVFFYGSRLPHRSPFSGTDRSIILIDSA